MMVLGDGCAVLWSIGWVFVTAETWRRARARRTVVPFGRRRLGDSGAAAVEFALVVPFLLILMFGIVDFGLAMFSQNMVGNAAREGARTASLGGKQDETETAAYKAMEGIIGTRPTESSGIVTTCELATGGDCPGWTGINGSIPAPSGATVTVKITYDYKWLTPIQVFTGIGSSLSFTRQSTMLVG